MKKQTLVIAMVTLVLVPATAAFGVRIKVGESTTCNTTYKDGAAVCVGTGDTPYFLSIDKALDRDTAQ